MANTDGTSRTEQIRQDLARNLSFNDYPAPCGRERANLHCSLNGHADVTGSWVVFVCHAADPELV